MIASLATSQNQNKIKMVHPHECFLCQIFDAAKVAIIHRKISPNLTTK
jgi:hypothetical protein